MDALIEIDILALFQIESNVIAVTVFHLIMNQMELSLVHNQKKIASAITSFSI